MSAVVIRAPSAQPVSVRPFPGLPVKVTPAADEPVRVRGTAMLPGPPGIGIVDVSAEPGEGETVVLVFKMSDGNVHRVSLAGGMAPAPQPNRLDLSGAALAGATATARLDAWLALAGAAAAKATANGQLALQTILNGHAVGEASASGSMALQLLLSGSAEARSSATAAVSMTLELAGTAVAGAQASGFLSLGSQIDLQGAATAGAMATGALVLELPLAGHAIGRAIASGALSTALDLSGSATARATATGAPSMSLALSAAATGQATATGAISIEAAAGGYDPDAQTYFNAMDVQPSSARKGLLDTLIRGLKSDAVWSEIVILYLFASHSEASACLNAHAPSAYLARKVNNPVFTLDRGFAGDGTGAFLETDFADNTAGTKWLVDSAFMGIWLNTAPDGRVLGVNGTTATFISQIASGSGSARLHGTNGLSFPSDNGLGFSAVNRDPTGLQTYRQGSRLGQHANTTAAMAAGTHQVFRSSASVFGVGRSPAVVYAGRLTDAQEAALYNRLNTYLTAIGAA